MAAVAHGWKKPDGKGPTEKVAKEFFAADSQQASNPGKQAQSTDHMNQY